MRVKVEAKELEKLQKKLERKANSKQGLTTRKVMREAVKPTLEETHRKITIGQRKFGEGTYRRGGALKESLRIRIVRVDAYSMRALIGTSRKSGQVGWRGHFLEYGTVRMKAKPFLQPAEDATKDVVAKRLGLGVTQILKDELE